MKERLPRRDFLWLSALSLGSLAFRPFFGYGEETDGGDIARVATYSVSVHSQPSDKSPILYQRSRDELINIYEEIIADDGPIYNPRWYRVWRGFVHSAHLQRVKVRLNPVADATEIPEKRGRLAEVSVPLTQTMRFLPYKNVWEPVYRLYYSSTHWVRGIDPGPDGTPWYRLQDELTKIEYHAPAIHFRLIPLEEFSPISSEVDPWKKKIIVSIAEQSLKAYENDQIVLETSVSTGIPDHRSGPGHIPTDTPTGQYNVYSKMPSKHMGNGQITSSLEAYELPGVPWTIFFAPHGVALHGTYWHTNYGLMMSHGCVNLRPEESKWLFRWTMPFCAPDTWEQTGYGTIIIVK